MRDAVVWSWSGKYLSARFLQTGSRYLSLPRDVARRLEHLPRRHILTDAVEQHYILHQFVHHEYLMKGHITLLAEVTKYVSNYIPRYLKVFHSINLTQMLSSGLRSDMPKAVSPPQPRARDNFWLWSIWSAGAEGIRTARHGLDKCSSWWWLRWTNNLTVAACLIHTNKEYWPQVPNNSYVRYEFVVHRCLETAMRLVKTKKSMYE